MKNLNVIKNSIYKYVKSDTNCCKVHSVCRLSSTLTCNRWNTNVSLYKWFWVTSVQGIISKSLYVSIWSNICRTMSVWKDVLIIINCHAHILNCLIKICLIYLAHVVFMCIKTMHRAIFKDSPLTLNMPDSGPHTSWFVEPEGICETIDMTFGVCFCVYVCLCVCVCVSTAYHPLILDRFLWNST